MARTRLTHTGDTPLIAAVEGLCFAGKSTLIRHLAPLLDAVVAPEYTDLADLPPWPPTSQDDVTTALHRLLELEQGRAADARARLAHRSTADGPGIVLLDRSPLTLIAHEHGMRALNVPADPAGAAHLYADAADAASIMTPDVYLYLVVPDQITAARRAARGAVAAHLDDPRVRDRIDGLCRTWMAGLPPARRLVLDATVAPEDLARIAAGYVRAFDPGSPAPPSWRSLADHAAERAPA
ncbi:hypothetical protein [Actinoplanes sp. NPDC051851]|uniref:hypothetical protein n=1 Tax=Actinoplanes sp. NPDC051851 TaxID=3154753 RepID=UPI003417E6D9